MKLLATAVRPFFVIALLSMVTMVVHAYVPMRISVKFILDADDNRPANGSLNTDAEIIAEIDWASEILSGLVSELRVSEVLFVDLPGVSQYYNVDATGANRDALRADALADKSTYRWDDNAVNIYINGYWFGSAISKFPPTNDIILMNQNCGNTPSCVLHELGHSLNLAHTHETAWTNGDACADTITDNSGWTRDQISQANFSKNYADLSAVQRDQVDLVWNNVMSYHTNEPQLRLSPCQMDRISNQADNDRGWLLSKVPYYVDAARANLVKIGTWDFPFATVQEAFNTVNFSSSDVLVIEKGTHSIATPVAVSDAGVNLVTRSGTSLVKPPGRKLINNPPDLTESSSREIREMVRFVSREDASGRKVIRDAKHDMAGAKTEQERADIERSAVAQQRIYNQNALSRLIDAERSMAVGMEQTIIQLEIAQRYRDTGDCTSAIKFFGLVEKSAPADEENLKARVRWEIEQCMKRMAGSGADDESDSQIDEP